MSNIIRWKRDLTLVFKIYVAMKPRSPSYFCFVQKIHWSFCFEIKVMMNQRQVDQPVCKWILVVQVVKCQNKLKIFTGLFFLRFVKTCPIHSWSYNSLLAAKDVVHMHKCGGVQSLDDLFDVLECLPCAVASPPTFTTQTWESFVISLKQIKHCAKQHDMKVHSILVNTICQSVQLQFFIYLNAMKEF